MSLGHAFIMQKRTIIYPDSVSDLVNGHWSHIAAEREWVGGCQKLFCKTKRHTSDVDGHNCVASA